MGKNNYWKKVEEKQEKDSRLQDKTWRQIFGIKIKCGLFHLQPLPQALSVKVGRGYSNWQEKVPNSPFSFYFRFLEH